MAKTFTTSMPTLAPLDRRKNKHDFGVRKLCFIWKFYFSFVINFVLLINAV